MLDCIEVISPKGGVKGTICGLKRQTTIVFYSDKQHHQKNLDNFSIGKCQLAIGNKQTTIVFYCSDKHHYQNKSWQLFNRQVGIIIARGTMDPRIDCSCLSQSLNEEQGIILKSFTAITMKWISHSEKKICRKAVVTLSSTYLWAFARWLKAVVSSRCWVCKSSIDQISPISVS